MGRHGRVRVDPKIADQIKFNIDYALRKNRARSRVADLSAVVAPKRTKQDRPWELICEEAFKFCLLGATNEDLCDLFDISDTCFRNWQKDELFAACIRNGRAYADANVANSLYKRACGYEQPSEKVFCDKNGRIVRAPIVVHYPPDAGAALSWLKNRRPDKWSDTARVQLSSPDGGPLLAPMIVVTPIKVITHEELAQDDGPVVDMIPEAAG